jgi:DNA-binding NarL/FixJ family response regulator
MKRILVADDHETVRSGLRAILEGRAGWEVVAEARDGNEAVAEAIEKRPDVAIIDYSMPLMSGVEVTRRIKEHQLATEILRTKCFRLERRRSLNWLRRGTAIKASARS